MLPWISKGEITVSESGDVTVITSKRRSLNQTSTPTGRG